MYFWSSEMTERIRSQIQAAEMSLLFRVAGHCCPKEQKFLKGQGKDDTIYVQRFTMGWKAVIFRLLKRVFNVYYWTNMEQKTNQTAQF